MPTLNLDSVDSREDFKELLATRAVKDREFRQLLLADPGSVLARELGADAASGVSLTSREDGPGAVTYVVTYNPKSPAELQDLPVSADEGIEAVLVKRAWKDPDYRRELLADPRKKLKDEFGLEANPAASVNILEEDRERLCLVLPPRVAVDDQPDELSDEDLENVVGGSFLSWLFGENKPDTVTSSVCRSCASGVRG